MEKEKRVLCYSNSSSLFSNKGYESYLLKYDKKTRTFSRIEDSLSQEKIFDIMNFSNNNETVEYNALVFKCSENLFISINVNFDEKGLNPEIKASVDHYEGPLYPKLIVEDIKDYLQNENVNVIFTKISFSESEIKKDIEDNKKAESPELDIFLTNFDLSYFDQLK